MSEELDIEELAPWLVIFITLIGGGLRVLLLPQKGMWLDETFSVWVVSHSVGDMLRWIVKVDQHPPLYYFLLHYWVALYGDAPYDARLLSALFGTATIPILYLIGKRMSGVVMGLAAAMFFALSPFNIYFAQETRMYTCLTFNAAIAIYALIRLLTDPRSVRPIGSQFREYWHAWRTPGPVAPATEHAFSYQDETRKRSVWRAWIARHRWLPVQAIETDLAWVALIVFSAAMMLTHNTAVLFPVATNIFVLGLICFQRLSKKTKSPHAFQAPSLKNWVNAQIGIFVLWSPWLWPFINQTRRVYQEFWIPQPDWETVIGVLESFLNASLTYLHGRLAMAIRIQYALVFCLGLLHYRKNLSRFVFLVALFAIPFLGELIVSIRRPIFSGRTLIWTTIPLFLLLAAGMAQLRFRVVILAAIVILGTHSVFSASDYYRFFQKEDWNTPAGYVANFAQQGDLVLFNSNFVEISFNYYFRSYEQQYAIQVEKQGVPADLIKDGILEPKMTESDVPKLLALVRGHPRVWLVYSHDSYTDPGGIIPQTLASQMTLTRQRDFYGGRVQLYEAVSERREH